MRYLLVCCLLFLCGCSPSSLEDFQKEGQAFCGELIGDLKEIHNREQLVRSESKLKKRFNRLVKLMIEAKVFQYKHPDQTLAGASDSPFSRDLLDELLRIYEIEGGREVIERAQREAMIRLDAFEKTLSRHRKNVR